MKTIHSQLKLTSIAASPCSLRLGAHGLGCWNSDPRWFRILHKILWDCQNHVKIERNVFSYWLRSPTITNREISISELVSETGMCVVAKDVLPGDRYKFQCRKDGNLLEIHGFVSITIQIIFEFVYRETSLTKVR